MYSEKENNLQVINEKVNKIKAKCCLDLTGHHWHPIKENTWFVYCWGNRKAFLINSKHMNKT